MAVEGGSEEQEGRTPVPSSELALHQLVELEQQRIDRDNQRSNVVLKALEYADDQDKRQLQHASAMLNAQIALEDGRLRFFRRFAWAVLAIVTTVGVGLLSFALLGDAGQREVVGAIVTPAFIAIAGYGVIVALSKALKALSRGADPTA